MNQHRNTSKPTSTNFTNGPLAGLYRPSLALLTDLYELTMGQGYWSLGRWEEEAVFHLFFRRCPFGGGYAVAAGLAAVVDYLDGFALDEADLDYLRGLRADDGTPLFEEGFLDYLARTPLALDVDGMPEGTVVFPREPILRVKGPIIQAQLLETALLNLVNFPTLIATKASRVVEAARGEPVLEFGLRRAQGIDGGLTASRAAYLGGCAATSNVLAGRLFGIPVKGTHAHSWVMSFESEPEAFEGWARAMPHNSVFLVDTYDTLQGVANAIEAGRKLAQSGHKLAAVRLDSGDLGQLSRRARAMLDEAGFTETKVLGSGDLDEHSIAQLKDQGAAIGLWGVGTRLAVAFDEPALGGVYKLGAIRSGPDVPWSGRMKRSETPGKSTLPGIIEAVRFSRSKGGAFVGDALLDRRFQDPQSLPVPSALTELAPDELLERSELLVPIYRGGQRVHTPADLETARGLRASQVQRLPWPCRSLSPREGTGYPVCLDESLRPDQNGQAEG